jgi:uncharacterized membrane protein required for colicin V production
MIIAILIGIIIAVLVGINLIPKVNEVIKTITTPAYSQGIAGIAGILPIIFVTVIILGTVAWFSGHEFNKHHKESEKYPRDEDLTVYRHTDSTPITPEESDKMFEAQKQKEEEIKKNKEEKDEVKTEVKDENPIQWNNL